MPVRCESKPNQRLPVFPWSRNLTLIAQYWLVSGTDSSMIYVSRINCFTGELKINEYELKIWYKVVNWYVEEVIMTDWTQRPLPVSWCTCGRPNMPCSEFDVSLGVVSRLPGPAPDTELFLGVDGRLLPRVLRCLRLWSKITWEQPWWAFIIAQSSAVHPTSDATG